MRRGRENGLLKSDDGKLVGINLGSDFTSEHEWGIKGLKEKFGIPEKGYGIEKRTMTKLPTISKSWVSHSQQQSSAIHFLDQEKNTLLIVSDYFDPEKFDLRHMDLENYREDESLQTAWDEKTFGINATSAEDRQAVRDVYTAMLDGDVAIWLGGGGVFKNAGLVLAIVSMIPEDNKKQLYDADKDHEKLLKAAEATGIAKKLEKAGCKYYALSPKWAGEIKSTCDGEIKTKHPVIFWLNPMDQQDNEHGWYTVEILELWAQGKGPVIEKSKNKREKSV